MIRRPIFSSGPLITDVLKVNLWSIAQPTLSQLLSPSLDLAWSLAPLHNWHGLSRFIAIPSHSSSDPTLTASNVQKIIGLIGSSQLRQLRVPYHLLSNYLVGSRKFLAISLPAMDEIKDWAICFTKGMIVLSERGIQTARPTD